MDLYNETITTVLDKHAPVTTKYVPVRPATAWYDEDSHKAKCKKRCAERKWRKTGLEIDRQLYKEAGNDLTECVKSAKREHIQVQVEQAASDPRKVFFINQSRRA